MTNLQQKAEEILDNLEAQNMVDPAVFGVQLKYLHDAAKQLAEQVPEISNGEAVTILLSRLTKRSELYLKEEYSE